MDGAGVVHGEPGDQVDDATNADAGDDVGQREELFCVADGERVLASVEGRGVVRFQDPLGRGDVDEFLRVHLAHHLDGGVELVVTVPGGQVGQTLLKEGRFNVLEEVDGLKAGDCGGRDAGRSAGVGWSASGQLSSLVDIEVSSGRWEGES